MISLNDLAPDHPPRPPPRRPQRQASSSPPLPIKGTLPTASRYILATIRPLFVPPTNHPSFLEPFTVTKYSASNVPVLLLSIFHHHLHQRPTHTSASHAVPALQIVPCPLLGIISVSSSIVHLSHHHFPAEALLAQEL